VRLICLFAANSCLKSGTLDTKFASFGAFMATVFNSTSPGVDSLLADMMAGKYILDHTPLLLNVLNGGGWIVPGVLANPAILITDLRTLLQKDLIQRSINFVRGQSIIWVNSLDLNDDAAT